MADIRIESNGIYAKMFVDGEEISDVVQIDFHAVADDPVLVECSYWQHVRNADGSHLVLNDTIMTRKVTVF